MAQTVSEPTHAEPPPLPEGASQEDIDRHWLEHIYKPEERQLTVRAIVAGMLLGGIMSMANLYIGLRIGWSLGMAITSTILAFAAFRVLGALGIARAPFTMLENNTVASASSAAGYFASAGMVSAIPALFLTKGDTLQHWELALWMIGVSCLGVVMAVPMRRQMIDIDRLKFPSGTACAETIKSMHQSAAEAVAKARSLLISAGIAMLFEIPAQVAKFGHVDNPLFWGGTFAGNLFTVAGKASLAYTISLPTSLLMYGAGAIMGLRVGLSMGIGALVLYLVIAPWLVSHGVVIDSDNPALVYRSVLAWSVWPGVMGALVASLLMFFMKWRSIVESFGTLGKLGKSAKPSLMSSVEVPPSWFGWGFVASTVLVCFAAKVIFEIPIWMSIVAALLSFVLAIMACRATGETDTTPIGALGKITQLTFAALHPGNYSTNLMTGSITAGAASHSADLLTDLKTGYLLGGAPKRQFIAQFMGIIAGAIFCVPAYALVVGDGEKLGSTELPAPAAQTWAVVADLLAKGVHSAERGPAEVGKTAVSTVTIDARPPKMAEGDTLVILEGPDAGRYVIKGFERRTLLLDKDLTVPTPEAKEAGDAPQLGVLAQVESPDGQVRGGDKKVKIADIASKPAAKFATMPEGTNTNDYLRWDDKGHEMWFQVKAVRGDVAWLDHALPEGAALPVDVKKMTLPPYAMTATIIAMIVGIALALLGVYGPSSVKRWLPSVTGLGIAFVVNGFDSLAMMIGAILAAVWAKTSPKTEERYNVAGSSGIIAGASIAGLILIALQLLHLLELG